MRLDETNTWYKPHVCISIKSKVIDKNNAGDLGWPFKGHIAPYFRFFVDNFWLNEDTDMGMVPMCLSRQGASIDMQYDLPEQPRGLDLIWSQVKLRDWPLEVIKDYTGSTRELHWCQNYCSVLTTSTFVHEKLFFQKTLF